MKRLYPLAVPVVLNEVLCIEGRLYVAAARKGTGFSVSFFGKQVVGRSGQAPRYVEQNRWTAQILGSTRKPIQLLGPMRRIALVTSEHGVGPSDFQAPIDKIRYDRPEVELVSVNLANPVSIADGVRRAAEMDVDAIAVVRGGGPITELLPFYRESVCRAVADAAARRPLILGVGHREDSVPAERFVVHEYRADTPGDAGVRAKQLFFDSLPKRPPEEPAAMVALRVENRSLQNARDQAQQQWRLAEDRCQRQSAGCQQERARYQQEHARARRLRAWVPRLVIVAIALLIIGAALAACVVILWRERRESETGTSVPATVPGPPPSSSSATPHPKLRHRHK